MIQRFHDPDALIKTDPDGLCVEMWTAKRLPYGRRDIFRDVRGYLFHQLSRLIPGPGLQLYAKYVSPIDGFADTENVLFYNVGTSAFRVFSRTGLTFEREFSVVPVAPDENSSWQHYHRYSLLDYIPQPKQFLTPIARLIFDLPCIKGDSKPHIYWWPAKCGFFERLHHNDITAKPYGLKVLIEGPLLKINLSAIMKPLFDGIISALHFDQSILPDDPRCLRLSNALAVPCDQVSEALCNSQKSLFGMRKPLLRPTASFVAWNPADELCHRGELSYSTHALSNWIITAEVTAM